MIERVAFEEEIIEVFKKLPKESFELLLRNISIREHLENLWKKYEITGKVKKDEEFSKIFDEIFRFFFRPLEIFLAGEQYFKYILPKPDVIRLFESQRELFEAYEDFILSLISHMRITSEILMGFTFTETAKSLTESFVKKWWDFARRSYKIELDSYRIASEYPFIISKEASNDLFKAAEHWSEFRDAFFEFKEIITNTYDQSVEEFIDFANSNKIESFQDFSAKFAGIVAKNFDTLIKSEEYLKAQRKMLDNLMDYTYHTRKYFESILESSPLNPFATVSQMDEAYKRIMDLKRKVKELEKKVKELESKLEGVENVRKS